ncbi:hypothetical protein VTN00DRAFT_4569 [Thermoascus crustaceus]
MPLSNKYN